MKYLAVFDDDFLSNFRLDDMGLTLVLTDKYNCTRAVSLKPIQRYTLVRPDGTLIYLNDDHIQALIKFEENKILDDMLKDINKTFDELPKSFIHFNQSKKDLRKIFGLDTEGKE